MTPDAAAEARRPRALRREVRRRGPRRLDGRPPRQRARRRRRHLLARALRRHPRRAAPATSAPSSSSPRAPRPAASAAIEALTGAGALAHVAAEETALAEAAALLRARPEELARAHPRPPRRAQGAGAARSPSCAAASRWPAARPRRRDRRPSPASRSSRRRSTGVSGKDLRGLIDEHKARLGSGVILLVADTGDKAAVAAGVTDDLTGRISAVDLVRVAAEALGGKGGGGRPDMAQAGGADPAQRARRRSPPPAPCSKPEGRGGETDARLLDRPRRGHRPRAATANTPAAPPARSRRTAAASSPAAARYIQLEGNDRARNVRRRVPRPRGRRGLLPLARLPGGAEPRQGASDARPRDRRGRSEASGFASSASRSSGVVGHDERAVGRPRPFVLPGGRDRSRRRCRRGR